MSFVKHAIFLDEGAPKLTNYEALTTYILNRFSPKSMFITEGILDALDHSSPDTLVGGKLGIDSTAAHRVEAPHLLGNKELFTYVKELIPDAVQLHQFMRRTKNPITVISVEKTKNAKEYFDAIVSLSTNIRIVVFVDAKNNDIENSYMTLWRVSNNIDAQRDIFVSGLMVGIDATNKNLLDSYKREWPDDVECTPSVVESLKKRGIWDLDDEIYEKYQL